MPTPFEEYDDLDALAARLKAADAGERSVAVMELGHSGDPAAIALLDSVIAAGSVVIDIISWLPQLVSQRLPDPGNLLITLLQVRRRRVIPIEIFGIPPNVLQER